MEAGGDYRTWIVEMPRLIAGGAIVVMEAVTSTPESRRVTWWVVTTEDGQWTRAESFPAERSAAALARFEELAGEGAANLSDAVSAEPPTQSSNPEGAD